MTMTSRSVSDSEGPDARQARIREHAVRDVTDRGMSIIGAAVLWGLKSADLERWVADHRQAARADERSDS